MPLPAIPYFILVGLERPEFSGGVAYWAKSTDLSPVGNGFGL
jgi:hypothetical protein